MVAAVREPGRDLASLCPADARLVIAARDLSVWRQQVGEDPLLDQLWKTTEAMREAVGWEKARRRLRLSEAQMQDRYLGRSLWVIEQKIGGRRGLVVAARSEPPHLRALRGAIDLVPMQGLGPFAIGLSRQADSKNRRYLYGFSKQWLFMTEARNNAHLRRLITAVAAHRLDAQCGAPPLGPTYPDYAPLLKKTDPHPRILILSRNDSGSERHVASVVRRDRRVSVSYAAQIPSLRKMAPRFEYGSGVNFGLLPGSVVSAGSINVVDRKPEGVGALDLLVYPKSIEKDVLPKIDAPMILFMGHVQSDQIDPNPLPGRPPMAVPVVGMALHMKDPTVASDLDTIVRRSHLAANMMELDVIKTIFGFRSVRFGRVRFTVADFGRAIAKRIKDPKMAALLKLPSSAGLTRLSFGRIGSWYLICSQEAFFKQCVEAHDRKRPVLSDTAPFRRFQLRSHSKMIATVITRADALRSMLEDIDRFWEDFTSKHDDEIRAAEADKPKGRTAASGPASRRRKTARRRSDRAQSPLRWISGAMEQRRSFALQMWLDSDSHLVGSLNLVGE